MVSRRGKHNRYKNADRKGSRLWKPILAAASRIVGAIALLASASLLLIFAYDLLLQSRYFEAERITVAGCERLSRQEVIAQAGLRQGINTLAVNLSVARKRLLAHPWIADAKVRREFPGALHIRVQEERPVAIVSIDRPWLVNEYGNVFKAASKAEADGLPIVSGLSYVDLPTAGSPAGDAFRAVMTIFELGNRDGTPLPSRQIDQITVDRDLGLTIIAFGGQKSIRMGYGDYAVKYDRLQHLIRYLDNRGKTADFSAIDLSSPDRAVATPASTAANFAAEKEV